MEIGEIIPNHLGIDGEGRMVTASGDYAHTPLIIYFYPKDNTPGCTAESCALRDGYQRLQELGYQAQPAIPAPDRCHRRSLRGVWRMADEKNVWTRIYGSCTHDLHHGCGSFYNPHHQQSQHQTGRRTDSRNPRQITTRVSPSRITTIKKSVLEIENGFFYRC